MPRGWTWALDEPDPNDIERVDPDYARERDIDDRWDD